MGGESHCMKHRQTLFNLEDYKVVHFYLTFLPYFYLTVTTVARHKIISTIFCFQIDPSGWHLKIGNETIAKAILDRIIHDSYQILIDGEISMRERHGLEGGF